MRTLSILKTVSAVAAVSAIAITATTVKASAITINLTSPTITDPSGIVVSSSANAIDRQNPNTVYSSNVFSNSNGLGIVTTFPNPQSSDNTRVDGLGAIETLTLAFNQAVSINSVTFAGVRGILSDSFTFLKNGNPNPVLSDVIISSNNGTYTYTFAPTQTGTSFGFQGSKLTSAFYVSSVDVTAVPEPITIAGMALGSGFGVLLRRKYKKAAKFSNKLST